MPLLLYKGAHELHNIVDENIICDYPRENQPSSDLTYFKKYHFKIFN